LDPDLEDISQNRKFCLVFFCFERIFKANAAAKRGDKNNVGAKDQLERSSRGGIWVKVNSTR
jgi:hypothetical protein